MSDLTRRDRLRGLESEIRSRNAALARDLWAMGTALREVQREELWRETSSTNFDAWLAETAVTGRSTAYKAMRIAEVFAEEMAARFGTEKLDAGIRYLDATAKREQPGDLLALHLRLRGDTGAWVQVPFVEASATQIREAAALVQQSARRNQVPKALRTQVERFNARMPAQGKALRSSKLRLKRDRAGQVMVSVSGVPLTAFADYAAEVVRELAASLDTPDD